MSQKLKKPSKAHKNIRPHLNPISSKLCFKMKFPGPFFGCRQSCIRQNIFPTHKAE
jgi:hypothetical protein